LVALPNATRYGCTIFGKNSDREPNESQLVEFVPRMKRSEDYAKLTFGVVPQVKETYAVLVVRPWWIYGAEMGINEYGVAIGNVAVFTKEPYEERGILGMDMVRLALERARTAGEALRMLVSFIEEYGQGGNYSYEKRFRYHNSFIIADSSEAWVLETAGRYWVAKKVKDVYSISNALSIESEWDLAHDEVVKRGVSKHGCSRDRFSFAECFSDRLFTWASKGRERRRFTYSELKKRSGRLAVEDFIAVLRSHTEEPYKPSKGSMRDICMHYGGPLRPSQTASSAVFVICPWGWIALVTGTSNPCISLYKPLQLGAALPSGGCSNKYSDECYWWRAERLHRKLNLCYEYAHEYAEPLRAFEKNRIMPIVERFTKGEDVRTEVENTLREALQFEEEHRSRWISRLEGTRCRSFTPHAFWVRRASTRAGLPSI